jgi:hypothetical protein
MSSFIQEDKDINKKEKKRKNKHKHKNKINSIKHDEVLIKVEENQNEIIASSDKKIGSKRSYIKDKINSNLKSNKNNITNEKKSSDTTLAKKGLLKVSKDVFTNLSSSSSIKNDKINASSTGNVTNDINWSKLQEKKNITQDKSSSSSSSHSKLLSNSYSSIEGLNNINICTDEEREIMKFDSNLLKIKHLESNFNNSIKNIEKDDYYLLGPAIGSPEMYNYFIQIEKLLIDNLKFNSLSITFKSSINNNFISILWQIYLSQLNIFISAFNKPHLYSSMKEHRDRILNNFIYLIKQFQDKIINLIEIILSSISKLIENKMMDHSFNITCNESISTLYLSIGNLYKMKESYMKESYIYNINNDGEEYLEDKGKDLEYFHKANNYSPWVGNPYKSISSIYKSNGKIFESIYYLTRSMSVLSSYDGHEPLLSLFEYIKRKTEELEVCNSFSAIKFNKHRQRFHYNFLTSVGLAYGRAGVDLLMSYIGICKKHLAMMLQMMKIDCNKSSINSITTSLLSNKMEYKRDINCPIIDLSTIQSSSLIDHIVDDAYKSILMIISLLSIVMKKYNIKDILNNITLSNITYSVHSIKCIPGFFDLSRLLIDIVCIFLCGDEVHTIAINCNHFKCVCKSINVFTMWLKNNQEFCIISLVDKELWVKLEDCMSVYYNSLPSGDNDLINIIVEEDKDLLNFLPLENCNNVDIINNNKIIQQYLLIDNHLDKNSLLIRITRFKDIIKYLSNIDIVIGELEFNNDRIASTCSKDNYSNNNNNNNLKILNINNKIDLKVKSISNSCSKRDSYSLLFESSANKDINRIEALNNDNNDNNNEIEIIKEKINKEEKFLDKKLEVDNCNINLQFQSRILQNNQQLMKRKQQQKQQLYYNLKPNKPSKSNHLIVLDASNIAMRHGLNLKFSCLGIQLVLDFFNCQGQLIL